MSGATPVVIAVLVAELIPAAAFGFAAERIAGAIGRLPFVARIVLPAVLVLPYVVIATTQHIFRWDWFALYALLPVAMAWLLARAAQADPEQRGNWRDAIILLTLGLAVDLRWFDAAWPAGARGLANLLLVDAGLYGFLGIRRLSGTGFDFHLRWSDWKSGMRELVLLRSLSDYGRPGIGFPSSSHKLTGGWQGCPHVGRNICFCRGAGRTFLSRLGAKLARAASWPMGGLNYRVSFVRPVAFQQTISTLQLALCSAGHDRGNLLRPSMA